MNSSDVIFLLGAGASRDAGLKTSDEMTLRLEERLKGDWEDYARLYNVVKAGILYGDALKGAPRTTVNIEELVNVLTELARCEDHPIYPFIASWNMVLKEEAGENFLRIKDFRKLIIKTLVEDWVKLEDARRAEYLGNFKTFQSSLGTNLKIFSLNYDVCVETGCERKSVFTGFVHENDRAGEVWNEQAMKSDDLITTPIRLYKLHGSVDWRKEGEKLVSYDSPKPCEDAGNYQLIFGTANKMRSDGPYLFFLSAFRDSAFDAKLIVTVGYSFQDGHINSILTHAFSKGDTKLLNVSWHANPDDQDAVSKEKKKVASVLGIDENFVDVCLTGAKAFLERELTKDALEARMIDSSDCPF